MKKLILLLAALLTAMTTRASTFTVTNSGSTFTITRSSSSGTESVYYRTVSLSAIAGVHFTEAVGILEFLEGESQKTVTVTETPINSIAVQYLFQTGTTRTYRFEVLDLDGSQLDYINRDITYGSDYQHTANYVNRSITDLVYFDDNGNIKSGSGNKYLDVAYSSTAWIKVTDAGYPQGVHTISTDGLYHGSSALRTYLDNQGNKMYATVYFTQKEEEDGYQYIQILADNSTTYDDNDPRGLVNDPSISLYKACFEMRVTDGFVTDEHYQFFPHRYDYVNKAAEIAAGLSCYAFDYDDSHLYGQKYQSSSVNAPNTGSLDLATTVNNLDIRFDAGGYDKDDWDFKGLKIRLALVDNTAPTVLDNFQVSGGPYYQGNTIYVSVPFSEIVTGGGATTLSTTWGTLNYAGGSGSNVLTFSGTISDDASGTFAVNSYSGTINDLAGNPFSGTISHNFDISLDNLYSITYDLAGGTLPEGQSNPETYTELTSTFTLNNPIRPGHTFMGWTGSNGDTPQLTVTIEHGSEGDRSYTANWERLDLDRFYTFDSETGTLALLWGEFNNTNKWGDEVNGWAVKSVTATNEVSFTGNCSNLFFGFNICTSMDLSNVNTSGMTNAANMFMRCSSLTSLDLSGWNTANVTDMNSMFYDCSCLTTLDLSGWNTCNVTDMSHMFHNCTHLTSLDLTGFNTANVTNMSDMFYNCYCLTSLDLSGFNTANVTDMNYMFSCCNALTTIYASEGWSTENVSYSSDMFSYCNKLVGGMGTTYDPNYTDKTYARIDGGPDNPGYFTYKAPHRYTFDSTTGALALLWGEFNKDNKWGDKVTASAVKSVTATSDVNFTGDCSYLFDGFCNCDSMDLSNVNTTDMTNCSSMFFGCTLLTSLDLSGWNTCNVTDMSSMFQNCSSLTSLDLSGWNTANTVHMYDMFSFCSGLTTIYAGEDWSTGSVIYDFDMFRGCTKLVGGMGTTFDPNYTNKTYAHIDGGPSNPGYFTYKAPPRYTFDSTTGALALLRGEFNMFNKWGDDVTASAVKSVTATNEVSFTDDCANMFYNFTNCESIDLSKVNTSKMTNAAHMFNNCRSLTSLDLSDWNTDSVTNMSFMFNECRGLTTLDLSGWNTANVDDMTRMFNRCESLTSLDLSHWNTDSVTSMNYMFSFCPSLTSLDVSGWNTAKVTDMNAMFGGCEGLTSLDLSHFNTVNVTDMSYMFVSCTGLTTLDISGFNTDSVTDMSCMFADCPRLTTIYASEDWNTENVVNSEYMFYDCTKLVGGMGTTFDPNYLDKTYARIDGGPSNPGYFTAKTTALRGDVNGDNDVSIADVTALIDYLLSGDASGINTVSADCNLDSDISIADVTALIDYLLSSNW